MLPYLIILLISLISVSVSLVLKPSAQKILALANVVMLTLFSALRNDVGPDTFNYKLMYDQIGLDYPESDQIDIEPIFALLIRSLNYIGTTSSEFIFLIAIFQGLLLAKILLFNINPLFVYIYTVLFYFNYNFNVLRQGIATLLIILSLLFFRACVGYLKSTLYFILGFMFHYLTGVIAAFYISLNFFISNFCLRRLLIAITFLFCITICVVMYMPDRIIGYSEYLLAGTNRIGPTFVLVPILVYLVTTTKQLRTELSTIIALILWLIFRILMGVNELFGRVETFFLCILVVLICIPNDNKTLNLKLMALYLVGLLITTLTLNNTKDYVISQDGQTILISSPYLPYKSIIFDDN